MSERSYTVSEIIRMRKAVSMLLTFYASGPASDEQSARIEDELRTYMTAGVHPDDLETAAREHEAVQWQAVERTIPGGFGG